MLKDFVLTKTCSSQAPYAMPGRYSDENRLLRIVSLTFGKLSGIRRWPLIFRMITQEKWGREE